jgi:hypothetical protein
MSADRGLTTVARGIVAAGIVAAGSVLLVGCSGSTNGSPAAVATGFAIAPGPTAGAVTPPRLLTGLPAAAGSSPPTSPTTAPSTSAASTASERATPGTTAYATGVARPPSGVASSVPVHDSDGCDRSYGVPGQCIPVVAPGGAPVTCAFLAAQGFLPLLVTEDHLALLTAPGARGRLVDGARYLVGCGP